MGAAGVDLKARSAHAWGIAVYRPLQQLHLPIAQCQTLPLASIEEAGLLLVAQRVSMPIRTCGTPASGTPAPRHGVRGPAARGSRLAGALALPPPAARERESPQRAQAATVPSRTMAPGKRHEMPESARARAVSSNGPVTTSSSSPACGARWMRGTLTPGTLRPGEGAAVSTWQTYAQGR